MGDSPLSKRNIQTLHSILARNKPGYLVVRGSRVRVKPQDITDEKTGGILPLAALIPLIIGAVGAAGGVAGGTAAAVSAGNTRAHQLEMEKIARDKGVNIGRGYYGKDGKYVPNKHLGKGVATAEDEILQAIEVLKMAGYTVLHV